MMILDSILFDLLVLDFNLLELYYNFPSSCFSLNTAESIQCHPRSFTIYPCFTLTYSPFLILWEKNTLCDLLFSGVCCSFCPCVCPGVWHFVIPVSSDHPPDRRKRPLVTPVKMTRVNTLPSNLVAH